MKKLFTSVIAFTLTLSFSSSGFAATPVATYSFDGDTGNATPVERIGYYSDDGIVPSDGDSFTYSEGKLGQSLHINGFEALNLNAGINSESYTVSYWIKPEKITNFTPTVMITPFGFEADTFINITLSSDNLSPNIWSHTFVPQDERPSIGLPGFLSAGEWTHITMVVDENMSNSLLEEYGENINEFFTGAALYINGYLLDIGKVPKGMCTPTSTFWFGVNIWDDMYTGDIDELYIYDTALSDTEVKDLFVASGGNPDEKAPSGSTNQNNGGFNDRPPHGSFSDNFVEIEQGTITGLNNHLNLDNASPITTQGVETTTNAYANMAAILGFGFTILSAGFLLQHIKYKRNSYY